MRAGFNGGYYTINEARAVSSRPHFGQHGPAYPIIYGTVLRGFDVGRLLDNVRLVLEPSRWMPLAGQVPPPDGRARLPPGVLLQRRRSMVR